MANYWGCLILYPKTFVTLPTFPYSQKKTGTSGLFDLRGWIHLQRLPELLFHCQLIQWPDPLPQHRAIGGDEDVGGTAKHPIVFDHRVGIGVVPVKMHKVNLRFIEIFQTAHGSYIASSGRSPVGVDVEELEVSGFGDDGDVLRGVETAFVAAGDGGRKVGGVGVLGGGRGEGRGRICGGGGV